MTYQVRFVVSDDSSKETLLDKVQALSDAFAEMKGVAADLRCSLTEEKDKLDRLLDGLDMSRLEYDSFRDTGKLPPHLLRRKTERDSSAQVLRMDADVLLEAVGLSGEQYVLYKRDDEIDWNKSSLGKALNQLIAQVEREISGLSEDR